MKSKGFVIFTHNTENRLIIFLFSGKFLSALKRAKRVEHTALFVGRPFLRWIQSLSSSITCNCPPKDFRAVLMVWLCGLIYTNLECAEYLYKYLCKGRGEGERGNIKEARRIAVIPFASFTSPLPL